MIVSNRNLLFQGSIFRFHVCFGWCTGSVSPGFGHLQSSIGGLPSLCPMANLIDLTQCCTGGGGRGGGSGEKKQGEVVNFHIYVGEYTI